MIKKIALAFLVVIIAAYGFGFTRHAQIRTVVDIAAPPATVWAVLTDFENYANWNPFIVQSAGQAVVGTQLDNVMQAQHLDSPTSFKPTVLIARENEELRWLGHLLVPGLFDGEHYFLLEETEDGGTRFSQAEYFTGILLLAFDMNDFVPSFDALNQAIKAEAEAAADDM